MPTEEPRKPGTPGETRAAAPGDRPSGALSATRAILHLDGVGYARLFGDEDDATVVAIHRDLSDVAALLQSHGGTLHGRAGDSVLATFATVVEALAAAFAVQSGTDAGSASRTMDYRVGVHVGDVRELDGAVRGHAVNMAARLQELAEPGGICISRAVRDIVPRRLRVRFQSAGSVSLKNIDEPVEIFRCTTPAPTPTARLVVPDPVPASSRGNPSVLVRPIEIASSDPFHLSLALGFGMDLISRLARFRRLDVIGRTSSLTLSGAAPDPVAAGEVGAKYVVRGHLQVAAMRMQLMVLLIDAARERVLWSESFVRNLDDLFDVQAEITECAVAAMAVRIDAHERALARARDPESLDAYSCFVQGWQENMEDGVTGREATARAAALFNRALGRDSTYAGAVAGLARTASIQWRFGWSENREESMGRATDLAVRAIEMDANEPLAHSELGFVTLYRREHARSLAAYERALELNPSDAEIIAFYADALKHSGEPATAIPLFDRALRLNPLKPDIYLGNKAHAHFLLGDFDETIRVIRRMRQPLTAQRVLTAALMLSGREEEGRREAARLRARLPGFSARTWCAIVPDRLPEHSSLLREGLERAGF